MKEQLSKRQSQIYNFILSQVKSQGYPPSVREIASSVGLSSPSTVHSHLSQLEKKGYIKRDPSKPRAIVACQIDLEDDMPQQTQVSLDINMLDLPLVGQVAAGAPILAEQNIEESFKLPISLIGDKGSFLLKVRGESMIEIGIYSGDYVVVEETTDVRNGDVVVAIIDNEATVKTFYREDHRIRLQPENNTMQPIYAINPIIAGKVTSLFRTM